MARGIHRLSKVLPGPTMPNLSMSCPVLYIRNGLTSVSEVVHPQGGLRPSSTPLDIPRRTGLGGLGGNPESPNYQELLEGGGGRRVVELVGGAGLYGKRSPQTPSKLIIQLQTVFLCQVLSVS